MIKTLFWALSCALLVASCGSDDENPEPNGSGNNGNDETGFYEAVYDRFEPVEMTDFSLYDSNIIAPIQYEISGVVSGRKNKKVVYMHEDSSNRIVVFVYDYEGRLLGELVLTGTINRDWEDIAIGPGPVDGVDYIYVADFGDNKSVREEVRIYRFPEPDLPAADYDNPFKMTVNDIETITYQYPDGPRDAETLLLDKRTKDLIVVTKREARVHVYTLPYPQAAEGYADIEFNGYLPFKSIVGGDISPDGNEILIKDYGAIYHWTVEDNDPVKTMFKQVPQKPEYIPEVQGESLGWNAEGSGYFTITEIDNAANPILYHYKR